MDRDEGRKTERARPYEKPVIADLALPVAAGICNSGNNDSSQGCTRGIGNRLGCDTGTLASNPCNGGFIAQSCGGGFIGG